MSTAHRDGTITVLDFESTGVVNGYRDEPWQLGLVQLEGGFVQAATCYETLLRIGSRPFNRHAPGRHGQVREQLATAPLLTDLWPGLKRYVACGVVLAAHNAATERNFLKAAFPLQPLGPWLDTLPLSRIAWPGLASHALEALLTALGLTPRVAALVPGRGAHDALYDAVGCAILLETLLHLPGWEILSLERLLNARPA